MHCTPDTSLAADDLSTLAVTWQVKASILCNLRCSYCYEWSGLDDERRLTVEQWDRVLTAVAEYRAIASMRHRGTVLTHVAWHGGEPLLWPLDYMKQVLAAQHRVLGDTDPAIRNVMQTNLFQVSDQQLDWLAASGFSLNVSMDGAAGVRVDKRGRDTTDRMLANLSRLNAHGIPWGAGVTLGAHNRNSLRDTYDMAAQHGAGWISVTPVFVSDGAAPIGELRTGASEAVSALSDLFAHWIERGRTVPVQPLVRCLWSVGLTEEAVPSQERRGPAFYETRFVVRPDGSLTSDLVSPIVLGNVLRESMSEILRSAGMARAVRRREMLTERHCALCRFQSTCDHRAAMDYQDVMPVGPCSIESSLCEYIADYSRRSGRAPLELLGWRTL